MVYIYTICRPADDGARRDGRGSLVDFVLGLATLLHILVFVYWLGGDLGAFYASQFVVRADLSPAERALAAKVLAGVDMAPRYALIWTFPTGLALAVASSALTLSWIWPGIGALAAIGWSLLAARLHRDGQAAPASLSRLDRMMRVGVHVGLLVAGTIGLAGAFGFGPWTNGGPPLFLALKLLLLATAIALGLAIRRKLAPFSAAFAALMREGATTETNIAIETSLAGAKRLVVLIWACLIAAAALGVFKPY